MEAFLEVLLGFLRLSFVLDNHFIKASSFVITNDHSVHDPCFWLFVVIVGSRFSLVLLIPELIVDSDIFKAGMSESVAFGGGAPGWRRRDPIAALGFVAWIRHHLPQGAMDSLQIIDHLNQLRPRMAVDLAMKYDAVAGAGSQSILEEFRGAELLELQQSRLYVWCSMWVPVVEN